MPQMQVEPLQSNEIVSYQITYYFFVYLERPQNVKKPKCGEKKKPNRNQEECNFTATLFHPQLNSFNFRFNCHQNAWLMNAINFGDKYFDVADNLSRIMSSIAHRAVVKAKKEQET